METYRYTVVLDKNEDGGYTVTTPALQGCVTEGDTIAQSLAHAREAIQCHLESLAVLAKPIPPDVKMVEIATDTADEVFLFKIEVEVDLQKAVQEVKVAQAA